MVPQVDLLCAHRNFGYTTKYWFRAILRHLTFTDFCKQNAITFSTIVYTVQYGAKLSFNHSLIEVFH